MMPAEAFTGPEHQPFYNPGDTGRAALLVHGFPGSPAEMRPVADLLPGWTTQGVLLPGFASEMATILEKKHTDWLNAVESAAQSLRADHDTLLVIGNSMGGALSIQVAARHQVDGLILFSPFWQVEHLLWNALPLLKHIVPRFRPFQLFKPDFSDPEFRKGASNFMPNADFDDPETQRLIRELEIPTSVFNEIRQVGKRAKDLAPSVKAPALVIQGDEDDLVTPERTKALVANLSSPVTYAEVRAAHNPLQPDKPSWPNVQEHIRAFVEQFA